MTAQAVVLLRRERVRPNPHNPRKRYDEGELLRFGRELKRDGFKQPLRVLPAGPDGTHPLLSGHRRYFASELAGIDELPALVTDRPLTEAEVILDQLLENDSHERLNPIDRAEAYQRLMALEGLTAAELARRLGRSETQVSNAFTVRSSLAPPLREHVKAGRIPASHAAELARLRDIPRQVELGEQVAAGKLTRAELVLAIKAEGRGKGRKEKRPPAVTVTFTLAGDKPGAALVEQAQAFLARATKLKDLPAEAIRACLGK